MASERHWPLDDLGVAGNAVAREAHGGCPFRAQRGGFVTNDDPAFDLVPGLALSCRVRFERLPGRQGVAVLSKGRLTERGGFLLRVDSADEANRLSFFASFGGSPEPRVSSPEAMRTNRWYDVAAGWDGTNLWLTVDGKMRRTRRPGADSGCVAPLVIGSFGGTLRDLRVRGGARGPFLDDADLAPGLRLFCSVRFDGRPSGETTLLCKPKEYLLRYDCDQKGFRGAFNFFVFLDGAWEPRASCPAAVETGRVSRVAAGWDGTHVSLGVDGRFACPPHAGTPTPTPEPLATGTRFKGRVSDLVIVNRRHPKPAIGLFRSRELLPRTGKPFAIETVLENAGGAFSNGVLEARVLAGRRIAPQKLAVPFLAVGGARPLTFEADPGTNGLFAVEFTLCAHGARLMRVTREIAVLPAEDPDCSHWQPPLVPTRTFHIDAEAGDDARDGLTPATAWRSFRKVAGRTLGPGERLLLKRGSVFNEELVVTAAGTRENWAEIGAYGEGPRPTIRRNRHIGERCAHIVDPRFLAVHDLIVCHAGKGLDLGCTRAGCRGLLIERCLAHHIEGIYRPNAHGIPEWRDCGGAPGAGGHAGLCVSSGRFAEVVMRDCESYQCSSGFSASGTDLWVGRMFCHDNFCPNTSPHPYLTDSRRAWLVDSVFDAAGWQASAGTMGIMLAYDDGLVIRGCHFLNQPDSKSHDEGGIDFEAAGANTLVEGCTFRNNAGAAIEILGLASPQVKNLHVRGSRFDCNNAARKLGPSEIYVWGGTKDRRIVCSNGLIEENGFVLNDGVAFYTNCAESTRADWTLRNNRAYATSAELNRALPLNDPPTVSAGAEIWTDAPTVALAGEAADDGLPAQRLATAWEQLEGPGLVRFADCGRLTTAATFPARGDYRLLLRADDGRLWRSARTAVHILPEGRRVAKAWTFSRNLDAEGWTPEGLNVTREDFATGDPFWNSFAEPVRLVGGDYFTLVMKDAPQAALVSADGLGLDLPKGADAAVVLRMNNRTSSSRMRLTCLWQNSDLRTTNVCAFAVRPDDAEDRTYRVPLAKGGRLQRLRLEFSDGRQPVTGTCRIDYLTVEIRKEER